MINQRGRFVVLAGVSIWFMALGPFRPYFKAFLYDQPPELVLVLGGDIDREHVGAQLASELSLPLVVSGGSNPEHAQWLVQEAGLPENQFKLDYRAQDTLENFTSLVDEFYEQGIQHALLVTSEDHLPRSMEVGFLVAGSRGIRLTPIAVSCAAYCNQESRLKRSFDWFRALTWVMTGLDLKVWASFFGLI